MSECANDGCSRKCGSRGSDCINDRCVCFDYSDDGGSQGSTEPYIEPDQTIISDRDSGSIDGGFVDSGDGGVVDTVIVDSNVDEVPTDSSSTDVESTEPVSEPEPTPEPAPEPAAEPIEAITGEAFLDYWDK